MRKVAAGNVTWAMNITLATHHINLNSNADKVLTKIATQNGSTDWNAINVTLIFASNACSIKPILKKSRMV